MDLGSATFSPRQPQKRGQERLSAAFWGREGRGLGAVADPGLLSLDLPLAEAPGHR